MDLPYQRERSLHTKLVKIMPVFLLILAVGYAAMVPSRFSSIVQAQDATPVGINSPSSDIATSPDGSHDESDSTDPTLADDPQADVSSTDDEQTESDTTPDIEATPSALFEDLSPSLTATFPQKPDCHPVQDGPELISQNGLLDYDCVTNIEVLGENIDPATIDINWTVDAAVDGGWLVQLRVPNEEDTWDTPLEPAVQLLATSFLESENWSTFDESVALSFGLRVYRVACGVESEAISIAPSVSVSSQDGNLVADFLDNAVEPDDPVENSDLVLIPGLIQIPSPTASLNGSLDFAPIPVTSIGPEVKSTDGTISLTINGSDQSCGDWVVLVRADDLVAGDGSPFSSAQLWLTSIDGEPIPSGNCLLRSNCTAVSFAATPHAAASTTHILGITLLLPDDPHVGSFSTTLTLSLGVASPTFSGDATGGS